MTQETEQKLLSDIDSIKRDVAECKANDRRLNDALIGTTDKLGALHIQQQFLKEFYGDGKPENSFEARMRKLEDERQQHMAVGRWFWPKVVGICTAIPGVIEIVHFFSNRTPPAGPTH